MRRIIERVVTVVTTTTRKISWEEDPLHPLSPLRAKPTVDPVFEIKEVDLPKEEIHPDQD